MAGQLLLVRHGETVWHAENRYAGSSDVDLTERGIAQAKALARNLAALPAERQPVALCCSPQERARRTAMASAAELGLDPDIRPELREAHFGIAEGRTLAEVDPDVAAAFRADPVAGAFPDAEPPANVAARGAAALRSIATEHGEAGPVLVVAHNTLLRLTLCELLGIPLPRYREVLPKLENGAITELRIDGSRTSLLRLNHATW